jgi:hypothetical protein
VIVTGSALLLRPISTSKQVTPSGSPGGAITSAQLPQKRRSSRVQFFPDYVDRLTEVGTRRDSTAEMRF